MKYLEQLRNAKNRKDLARLLGYRPSALTSIIYQTPLSQKYTTFDVPKKSGGNRTIKAPNPKLKKLQKHLSHFLYACLDEIEEERKAKPVSYGFRRKTKLEDNAKKHKRRRYVLNLDLEDFFPTFNFGRVRGYFLKDKSFQLEEQVATTIAQIACDGTALPQGSPSSPIISELIGQVLDLRMLRFARKQGVRYTRYVDDITFSTNQKHFPEALAVQNLTDTSIWVLGDALVKEIESAGFNINVDKTRMHYRGNRQIVTGLVVNEKANIKSEYYRRARAMCDSLFQTGTYFRSFIPSNEQDEEPKPDLTNSLNPLEGILSHIYSVTQSEDKREIADQRKNPRAIRSLYRRFLFYKYCIAPNVPLIITEGKTDSVYLKEAIKYRNAYHPRLGKPGTGGFEFAIQFFNYRGQAHEILGIGGGSGDLRSIPLDYRRNLSMTKNGRKPFKSKPLKFPVVLLLDNDDGLGPISSTIRNNFNVQISTSTKEKFYYITENLYLVKTPESGESSCIEDLFTKDTKSIQLNGKKFNLGAKIDPDKEFGKEVFANSVVKPNSKNIDFSGFDPLLDRILSVLDDYANRSTC